MRLAELARSRSLALLAVQGVLLLAAPSAAAQQPQPPAAPQPQAQTAQVRADAGAGLALIRALPSAAGATSQTVAELAFGLATSKVNSSEQDGGKSIAESVPIGLAAQGDQVALPGSLTQAAPPDNPAPKTQDFGPPASPADQLLRIGLANGTVHARWDPARGPCVAPLNLASTSAADVSMINTIPSLPSVPGLPGLPNGPSSDALKAAAAALQGPLSQLGGLLAPNQQGQTGSLISLPDTVHARTEIGLIDVPGQAGKGVQSVSRVQFASLKLLAGTPFELEIGVVSQPTLVVTATGDPATSKIEYTAPVLSIRQAGNEIYQLNAANPTFDLRLGLLPPGVAPPELSRLPVVGSLLPNGQPVGALSVIDIGVLRLSIGQLTKQQEGTAVAALARMLDIQLLPTSGLPLPGLPAALAQLTFGEQVARAATPAGGVLCPAAAPVPQPVPQPRPQPPLAVTNGAYHVIPLTMLGGGMLLVGVVLVAALPPQRRRPESRPARPADSAVP